MQINVTGHQVEVGRGLRDYAQQRLDSGVGKYFDGAIVGHIAFSREGSMDRTDIQVHVGKRMAWVSHADNADIRLSFSSAVDHIEKRLRRHKRKLRHHGK